MGQEVSSFGALVLRTVSHACQLCCPLDLPVATVCTIDELEPVSNPMTEVATVVTVIQIKKASSIFVSSNRNSYCDRNLDEPMANGPFDLHDR